MANPYCYSSDRSSFALSDPSDNCSLGRRTDFWDRVETGKMFGEVASSPVIPLVRILLPVLPRLLGGPHAPTNSQEELV